MTITDGTPGATDTVTVTLSGAGGTLSGTGLTANPDGSYTLAAADPATVTAELQALAFTPSAPTQRGPATTTLTLIDQSSSGKSASDATTTVTDVQPLLPVTLTGIPSAQTTAAEAPVNPFADATIADGNAGAVESVFIYTYGAGGTLSGTGLTATPYGYYTLAAADPATVTAELRGLTFTPTVPAQGGSGTTTLFVYGASSATQGAVYALTSVTDTPASVASYRPTADFTPDSGTTTDLTKAAGLTIGNGDSQRNDETILWGSAAGSDNVLIHDGSGAAQRSTLTLTDLGPTDVTFAESGVDLSITDKATGAVLKMTGQFLDTTLGVASVTFADGTTWNRDQIAAQAAYDQTAGTGDITLNAPDGDATLTSGAGNDVFNGGNGNDTFVYKAQSGNLTIDDMHQPSWGMNVNTLSLPDFSSDDVTFTQNNYDLVVAISGTGKAIDISKQFDPSTQSGVDQIQFANGLTLSRSDINQRLQHA